MYKNKAYKAGRYFSFLWGEAHNYSGHLTGQRKYTYKKERAKGFVLDFILLVFVVALIGAWGIVTLRFALITLIIIMFLINILRQISLTKKGISGHQLFLEEERIQSQKTIEHFESE